MTASKVYFITDTLRCIYLFTSIDINECSANIDNCTQVCINTDGSYQCNCDSGYSLSSDGRTCLDINECDGHHGQHSCKQLCTNIDGGFRCGCHEGFQLDTDQITCIGLAQIDSNVYSIIVNDCILI